MGFHKRTIDTELIKKYLELKKPLKDLFKVEVIHFEDALSSKIFDLYEQGLTDSQIKIIINENN